ncbi:hypothetical protein R80B4_03245 [Fibrobacteres bacterium R8-0-B4]
MITASEIDNPGKIYVAGIRALTDALGRDGAAVFMQHSAGKPGRDFAKWLSEQPETDDEEFEAEIAKIAADDMASGRLAGKMII